MLHDFLKEQVNFEISVSYKLGYILGSLGFRQGDSKLLDRALSYLLYFWLRIISWAFGDKL